MDVGKKIYFDKITGNKLVETCELSGDGREPTTEEDFETYLSLAGRNVETVGIIGLPFGQDRDKFGMYAYHFDPDTKSIVWDLTPIQWEQIQQQPTLEQRVSDLETLVLQLGGVI